MKNVSPFAANAFAFHQEVCRKKRNPEDDLGYKVRLTVLDGNIQQLFNQYQHAQNINNLQTLSPHAYLPAERTDLLSLYKYKSATIQKLKTQVTTTPTGRKVQCQNCTLNEVNTLDHLLPREEFPEFSVNPVNLFPCCSKCNSYKGDRWRENGLRTSLNLYIDQLPDLQYLFVNTAIGNNLIETEFYLNNQNGVDPAFFELISSHYRELHLLERFSEGADDVITSFRHVLEAARDKLSLIETKGLAKQIIEKEKIAFGPNYWQSILKITLIEDDDFLIDFD